MDQRTSRFPNLTVHMRFRQDQAVHRPPKDEQQPPITTDAGVAAVRTGAVDDLDRMRDVVRGVRMARMMHR